MKNKYRIYIQGLNIHHIISFFETNNYSIEDVIRHDHKSLSATILKSNYTHLKKSSIFNLYKIKIVQKFGINHSVQLLFKKSGLILGVILVFSSTIFFTNRIYKIDFNDKNHVCSNKNQCIYTSTNKQKLDQILKDSGVFINAKTNELPTNRVLEQILIKEFPQISGVSIRQKGAHLYINIVEAKLNNPDQELNLITDKNGIIISLNITNGTPNYHVGDIVTSGDVLVSSNNNKPVVAEIVLRTFYHDTIIYNENQVKYIKTGRTKTLNNLSLFGLYLNSNPKTKPYNIYESKKRTKYGFLNMFLPIQITSTTFFELKKEEKIVPYNSVSNNLKNKLTEAIKKNMPQNATIQDIHTIDFREGSRVRLDCYIEAYLTLKKEG